jgi:ArsR family transcriptional regulator
MLRITSENSTELSEELEEIFKALANVNRLLLIYSLASGQEEKVSVNQMAKIMDLTQPAASQHLKILKTAKILNAKKEGNFIYYTFNRNALLKHKQKIDFLFTCAFEKCDQSKSKLVK